MPNKRNTSRSKSRATSRSLPKGQAPGDLSTLLAHDGSYRATARRLGVSDSTVRRWVKRQEVPPARTDKIRHTAAGIKGYRSRAGLPDAMIYRRRRTGGFEASYRVDVPGGRVEAKAVQEAVASVVAAAPFKPDGIEVVFTSETGATGQTPRMPLDEEPREEDEALLDLADKMDEDAGDEEQGSDAPALALDHLTVVLTQRA